MTWTMTAYEYLKRFDHLPMSIERPCTIPTNSEIRRWLKQSAVIINGKRPKPSDEIEFPITELVYFPKGKRKTTVI
jgi:hypothetical protein